LCKSNNSDGRLISGPGILDARELLSCAEFYRVHGYVIVPEQLADSTGNIASQLPQDSLSAQRCAWGTGALLEEKIPRQALHDGPFPLPELSRLCVDRRLLSLAGALLGSPPLLAQWRFWIRYPSEGYQDQDLHVDYMNHTLVVPDHRPPFRYVEFIVYLTDIGPSDAPTFVVDAMKTRHLPLVPYKRDRLTEPGLYEYEKPVVVPAGSVFAFASDTWHRGSAYRAESGFRVALHLSYRTAAAAPWNGSTVVHERAYSEWFDAMLGGLDSDQYSALGFPSPDSSYWTRETIEAVCRRYPSVDLAGYGR
jgi:Phytanoyl-CoA dioxygenase (PhyH)